MGFWIYNMGMPVQVSSQQLQNERKVRPLNKQSQNAKAALDEQQMIGSAASDLLASKARAFANGAYQDGQKNSRKPVYQANQIMSSPVFTLTEDVSFAEAWQHFIQKSFRHFVITDKANKVRGILSDRDLLNHAASASISGKPPAISKTVGQLMVTSVLTGAAHTPIQEVCQVMFNQHIGALPIVADNGELLGIVTRSDILSSMIKLGPLELWI